jgi:hypothetical protein
MPGPAPNPPPHHDHAGASRPTPRISIVIPVYNEEGILHAAVVELRERLAPFGWSYEIILAENGSKDRTVAIAEELAEHYPEVRFLSAGEPNYGKALKQGILEARGEIVICDEIDLCDADFHRRAIALLDAREVELVIGSKLIEGAKTIAPGRGTPPVRSTPDFCGFHSAFAGPTPTGSRPFGARRWSTSCATVWSTVTSSPAKWSSGPIAPASRSKRFRCAWSRCARHRSTC